MKKVFFTFLVGICFATVNEPFTFRFGSSYRNDRIHWHFQDSGSIETLTYSELLRNVQFWEHTLIFKLIYRDLAFYLEGDYGAFGRGESIQEDHQSLFSTKGWTADVMSHFGYAVNLTTDRTYKVILIPKIGYFSSFEQLKYMAKDSNLFLPGPFRLVWNGFLFGASIGAYPGNRMYFQAEYFFHLMHNRLHTVLKNQSLSFSLQRIRSSSKGNTGHTGSIQIQWLVITPWSIGLNAKIHYFSTRVVDTIIRQSGKESFSKKLKLRWTVICGGLQISRQF